MGSFAACLPPLEDGMQLLEHGHLESHYLLIANVRVFAQRLQFREQLRMVEPSRHVRRVVQLGNSVDI